MDSVHSTSPSRAPRRHARRPRRTWFDRLVAGVGEILITAGLVVALFLVWHLWWTGIAANASAQEVQEKFEQTQVTSPMVAGRRHTEDRHHQNRCRNAYCQIKLILLYTYAQQSVRG